MKILKATILILCLAGLIPSPATASEPVNLKILTLDDRPPNYLFLKQFGAIAGVELDISFDPSDVSTAECVSLNAAVADSLVNSRTVNPWELEIPDINPKALVHFALPRVEPTVLSNEQKSEYARIRNELQNPDLQRQVLSSIQGISQLPDDQNLADYILRIRGWMNFLGDCGLNPDRLLITLDDNRPGPLSDGIKLILGEYSNYVYDGTDEGMMLLLARALREKQEFKAVTVPITWTHPADITNVMMFESSMVIENILFMADWLGVKISPEIDLTENYRPVLWINGQGIQDRDDRMLNIMVKSDSIAGRDVIVADIGALNGGDSILFDTWSQGHTPENLIGYLGWNTASNTIGSALALWICMDFAYDHTSNPEGVRAGVETFLWARLLDDYFYQRNVRGIRREYIGSIGADQYNLSDELSATEASEIAAELMNEWEQLGIHLAIPFRIVKPLTETSFIVELPWNRLFEIELYLTDDRGILPLINPLPD